MQTASAQDRRRQPRFTGHALRAEVRVKGQLGRAAVDVLDFNRHGLAIHIDRPLPKDQLVFLTLDHGPISLERVVGIVHNCLARSAGYRCGILFRTQSELQFDRPLVEDALARMESQIAESREEPRS